MTSAIRPAILGAAILAAVAVLPGAGLAQAGSRPAACSASDRGALACMAGETCRCDWSRGGSITDEPRGWLWSCHLEQMCGPTVPAGDGPSPVPPGSILEPQVSVAAHP